MAVKTISKFYKNLFKPKNLKPPYKHVCQIGDPVLRINSEAVLKEDINTPHFNEVSLHRYFIGTACSVI